MQIMNKQWRYGLCLRAKSYLSVSDQDYIGVRPSVFRGTSRFFPSNWFFMSNSNMLVGTWKWPWFWKWKSRVLNCLIQRLADTPNTIPWFIFKMIDGCYYTQSDWSIYFSSGFKFNFIFWFVLSFFGLFRRKQSCPFSMTFWFFYESSLLRTTLMS